jgi:hypothetical protein
MVVVSTKEGVPLILDLYKKKLINNFMNPLHIYK